MKKIWKILISILLLLATAVVLFSVFDHHAKKKTTIELFEFKPESTATFQTLINQFEKKNPNIHVELSAPGDAYTVLKARIVKGKIPDLIGLGGEQYYVDYAKANIFKNLSNDSMIKKFNPTYIKSLQYFEKSKKIYGVPYVANVSGVLYNKDLFKKRWIDNSTKLAAIYCIMPEAKEPRQDSSVFGL
ncbi:extracellular solute-binding protein [Oenococcus sicerae]|uniref:Extracellular solute-binding protein n=1 Tax=Oenococcus sicerae TaxID=2203724 RepID=A0ABX5QKK0_9LACO|nr:extracellular solute-binding protein [Oenococcus sicerae]QAS69292.1 extracellular solute-binding protein [Oenococcus sicerae]